MPASNVCWGIELGAGAVKALKLQRDGDDLKVLDFAIIPHKKVLSTPDLDQTEATRVAIGQLVSQYDLSGAAIAISVPGHSAFARFAKLPPVEPKKIPDIVKFEAVQQIPFPIEEVEWDYQTFASEDSPDVEVGIFAITRDRIMERLAMWNDVGVTPDFVTIGPIAAYNSVAFDQRFDDKTPGTVILDVGTTSTDLIVCEPGRLWIRTFPIGGHQFTQALVDAFKLSYTKAEALKQQAEQSKHARHVFQALRPVFGDLAQDVQRSIGYYHSSHKDANLTRLIGLGSTFKLPGLRKYLGQQLQMEILPLEQFHRLTVDGPAAGEFQAATLNLGTAYGLCLQGLGFDFGIMANLMPVPVVREAVWKKKTKWFAVAAGLSLAAGGLSFIRPIQSRPVVERPTPMDVDSVRQKIGQLKAQWTEVSGKFAADFEATNDADLIKRRDIHADLLNDLGLILASADSKKGDKAGFSFDDFTTEYLPPAAPAADGSVPAPPPLPPTAPPAEPGKDGAAPTTPALPVGTGRVRVHMVIQTTREDAEQYLLATVNRWLFDNIYRKGLPYMIDKSSIGYEKARTEVAKDSASSPSQPWSPPGGQWTPPANPGGGKSGGRLIGGGGGGGEGRPDERGWVPTPGGEPGGNAPSAPAPNAQAVEQLAPLPTPKPPAPPGTTIFKFDIHWDAVIMPEQPESEAKS